MKNLIAPNGCFLPRHGYAHPNNKTYNTWWGMIARCEKKSHKSYFRYGGRGITVCREWRQDFAIFLRDMGEALPGLTLGRIDNDGPYCKENCRWETMKEQMNNRSSNRMVTAFGETKTLQQWCDKFNLKNSTVYRRIKRGWDIETALTAKVRQFNIHNQYKDRTE